MKTKIYGFFNLKYGLNQDADAIAITEQGKIIATHICSNEEWAKIDLGMDGHGHDMIKEKLYDEACPDGWETEFVSMHGDKPGDNRNYHVGLQMALNASKRMEQCN